MSAPDVDGWREADAAGTSETAAPAETLDQLRREIEQLDRDFVLLISRRVGLARRIGLAKRAIGMPVLDPPREAAVVRRAGELAREAGLADEDVRYIFWHLIGLSRRAQVEDA